VFADRHANITYVDIIQHHDREADIYPEFSADDGAAGQRWPQCDGGQLAQVPGVTSVALTPSLKKIYGKRIIIRAAAPGRTGGPRRTRSRSSQYPR
jgi:uncharacterized protein with ACT and thioredoxin-like domain